MALPYLSMVFTLSILILFHNSTAVHATQIHYNVPATPLPFASPPPSPSISPPITSSSYSLPPPAKSPPPPYVYSYPPLPSSATFSDATPKIPSASISASAPSAVLPSSPPSLAVSATSSHRNLFDRTPPSNSLPPPAKSPPPPYVYSSPPLPSSHGTLLISASAPSAVLPSPTPSVNSTGSNGLNKSDHHHQHPTLLNKLKKVTVINDTTVSHNKTKCEHESNSTRTKVTTITEDDSIAASIGFDQTIIFIPFIVFMILL